MPACHWSRVSIRETEIWSWSDEDSAGHIVPLEGMGQQNPTRGKEPCFSHEVQSS